MTGERELHLYEKGEGYLAFELPAELKKAWKPLFGSLGYAFLLEDDHCWLHRSLLGSVSKLGEKSKDVCYFFTLEDPRKRKVGGIGTYSENLPPELGKKLNVAVLTHKNTFPTERDTTIPLIELDTIFSERMLSPYGPSDEEYWEFECRFALKAAKFILLQTADRLFIHGIDGGIEEQKLKMKKMRLVLNDFQLFLPGILACEFPGITCTFIWHSVYRTEGPPLHDEKRALLEETARSLGDRKNVRLLTVSADDRDFLSRGLDRAVALLPNGVPLKEIRSRIKEPGLKGEFDALLDGLNCAGKRVLLYLGRYEAYKGIYDLLEAAGDLLKTGDFALIYAFPLEDVSGAEGDIRERTNRIGFPEEDIKVLGYLGEKQAAALMHFSTVLVVPSRREPFGIIVLEGLAHETLVVGTKVGWIPKLLGEAGFLAEPGDVSSLKTALGDAVSTASDARLKRERITKGNKVVEGYTWERVAREFLKGG